MRNSTIFLASLFGLLLALACEARLVDAGEAIEEGYRALDAGQFEDSLGRFELALRTVQPQDERYREAKLGELRALCHLDPVEARNGFLSEVEIAGWEPAHYRMLVVEIIEPVSIMTNHEAAREIEELGIEILEAGKRAHPAYPHWDRLIARVETGRQSNRTRAERPLVGFAP